MLLYESVSEFKKSGIAEKLAWNTYTRLSGKKAESLIDIQCSFDTEFTSYNKRAYVYLWQFGILDRTVGQIVILERDIKEFPVLINYLEFFIPKKRPKNAILQVGVHNLSCDFFHFHKYLKIDRIFAKEKREILNAYTGHIKFIDTLAISGKSLEKTAKDFTETKKLVGDLDYSLPRHFATPLTESEKNYAINDVVIVCEYMQFLYDKYTPQGFFPLTGTQILRKMVKQSLESLDKNKVSYWKNLAFESYPVLRSSDKYTLSYDTLMTYVYRGGLTHANSRYKGVLLDDVFMIDYTSSYPARMFTEKFPMGAFNPCTWEKAKKSQHFIGLFRFKCLNAKTDHSIESLHKVVDISSDKIIDNGRIFYAGDITVWLTELDYENYKKMYRWRDLECIQCFSNNESHYLPKWFIHVLFQLYIDKDTLKKHGLPYALEKALLNSGYGLTVTKLALYEWGYIEGNIQIEGDKLDYYKQRNSSFLSPYWGIYISAYSRYELVCGIAECGSDAIYYDTDSIKLLNYFKHVAYILAYNKERQRKTIEFCKRNGLNFNDFYDLGCWDFEYKNKDGSIKPVSKFKTLGAKRYIYTVDDKVNITVAGLPKGYLQKLYSNKEIYNMFDDNMIIESCKNGSVYNDEYHSDYLTDYFGNTDFVEQESSMAIVPRDFTMSETAMKIDVLFQRLAYLMCGKPLT